MTPRIAAFAGGLVFALGLGLSGMTDPQRVLAFLDLTSPDWDPSLMLVLGAAVATYGVGGRLLAPRALASDAARTRRIDLPLVLGAALFGVGWGLVGLCPGPALVDLVAGGADVVLFVAAMLAGMAAFAALRHDASTVSASSIASAGARQP